MSRKKKKASKGINLQHWLIQKLRRLSYQWPLRKAVHTKARVSRGKYKCAICGGENFGPKEIQMDHLRPVIEPHDGFVDWNTYIDRLFCEESGWQCVCKVCHSYKTQTENAVRSEVKNKKQESDNDL